jgi:dTDP-4-dehydrorhamnose reductase
MHHGSGPPHTSLLDPEFPYKLASYAASVAEKYPWVDAYTPINEPHTTARFSGMYGVWFPHQSRVSCLRALLNQLRGIVLSMEAIRRVQPAARLIQTDDMGKISGTEQLRSVWELLDQRQWLPFDLLCGMVDRHHPMFRYMRAEGLAEHEVLWFSDHVCKPDVVGINYYVTSDRYIDHRQGAYPGGRSAEGDFVDVETVRVAGEEIVGFGPLLVKAWNRYGKPVAITEVHIGSTVDEQIRWVCEAWDAAVRAQQQGVKCVAMTIWALLGSYYWNELVTRDNHYYEPGVFTLRGERPIPTELASVVTQMAKGDAPRHPALSSSGWWHHPDRVFPGSMAA